MQIYLQTALYRVPASRNHDAIPFPFHDLLYNLIVASYSVRLIADVYYTLYFILYNTRIYRLTTFA